MKTCRPEPLLTQYLLTNKHISPDDLEAHVYPWSTIGSFLLLLPAGLAAERLARAVAMAAAAVPRGDAGAAHPRRGRAGDGGDAALVRRRRRRRRRLLCAHLRRRAAVGVRGAHVDRVRGVPRRQRARARCSGRARSRSGPRSPPTCARSSSRRARRRGSGSALFRAAAAARAPPHLHVGQSRRGRAALGRAERAVGDGVEPALARVVVRASAGATSWATTSNCSSPPCRWSAVRPLGGGDGGRPRRRRRRRAPMGRPRRPAIAFLVVTSALMGALYVGCALLARRALVGRRSRSTSAPPPSGVLQLAAGSGASPFAASAPATVCCALLQTCLTGCLTCSM